MGSQGSPIRPAGIARVRADKLNIAGTDGKRQVECRGLVLNAYSIAGAGENVACLRGRFEYQDTYVMGRPFSGEEVPCYARDLAHDHILALT